MTDIENFDLKIALHVVPKFITKIISSPEFILHIVQDNSVVFITQNYLGYH